MTVRVALVDPEGQLLQEIGDAELTRDDVALTYAMALADTGIDWSKVNHAIIDRWSVAALKYIKTKAWRLREEKANA